MTAQWVTAILQLVQTVAIIGFVASQLAFQARLIRRSQMQTFALISALSFIKIVRSHTMFNGPADEDPIRQLIEQLEKAIKL
jgi:hypothetical protein